MCSTPEGVTDSITGTRPSDVAGGVGCAQRPKASLIRSLADPTKNPLVCTVCSTPEGVTDSITPRTHPLRIVRLTCSTPEGVTDSITGTGTTSYTAVAACSTPEGVTDSITVIYSLSFCDVESAQRPKASLIRSLVKLLSKRLLIR